MTGWMFNMLGVGLLIVGCTTPAPIVMKPDIVEIEVPRAVLTPFDCQCQCEPHKALEIQIEPSSYDLIP